MHNRPGISIEIIRLNRTLEELKWASKMVDNTLVGSLNRTLEELKSVIQLPCLWSQRSLNRTLEELKL